MNINIIDKKYLYHLHTSRSNFVIIYKGISTAQHSTAQHQHRVGADVRRRASDGAQKRQQATTIYVIILGATFIVASS